MAPPQARACSSAIVRPKPHSVACAGECMRSLGADVLCASGHEPQSRPSSTGDSSERLRQVQCWHHPGRHGGVQSLESRAVGHQGIERAAVHYAAPARAMQRVHALHRGVPCRCSRSQRPCQRPACSQEPPSARIASARLAANATPVTEHQPGVAAHPCARLAGRSARASNSTCGCSPCRRPSLAHGPRFVEAGLRQKRLPLPDPMTASSDRASVSVNRHQSSVRPNVRSYQPRRATVQPAAASRQGRAACARGPACVVGRRWHAVRSPRPRCRRYPQRSPASKAAVRCPVAESEFEGLAGKARLRLLQEQRRNVRATIAAARRKRREQRPRLRRHCPRLSPALAMAVRRTRALPGRSPRLPTGCTGVPTAIRSN